MEKTDREIFYNVEKKRGLSEKELIDLMKKWQTKLQMDDWKLSLEIVEFRRKNGYRQSGDFIADPEKKEATILLTNDPWREERNDEEDTIVHEMLHILIYAYDKYNEDLLLKSVKKFGKEHDKYMDLLEDFVHHLTRVIFDRNYK